MLLILVGFVYSWRCAPCLPWPPEHRFCPQFCHPVTDEEYHNSKKKYEERVQEYYSAKHKDPSINSEIIQEKPLKCYPSHCYISISNPNFQRCTKDCRFKKGKITYIK